MSAVTKGTNAALPHRLPTSLTMAHVCASLALAIFISVGLRNPIKTEMQDVTRSDMGPHQAQVQPAQEGRVEEVAVAQIEDAEAKQAAPEPEPDRPWAINESPNGGLENVNRSIAHLQSLGLTKQGVAMIIGNFLQEKPSAFITGDPCTGELGDGGLAHGFGQWHPGRREDMPCGFIEQLTWAIDVEMVRDNAKGGGHNLSGLLRDPSASVDQLDEAIHKWERYSHKGLRYEYGLRILAQL